MHYMYSIFALTAINFAVIAEENIQIEEMNNELKTSVAETNEPKEVKVKLKKINLSYFATSFPITTTKFYPTVIKFNFAYDINNNFQLVSSLGHSGNMIHDNFALFLNANIGVNYNLSYFFTGINIGYGHEFIPINKVFIGINKGINTELLTGFKIPFGHSQIISLGAMMGLQAFFKLHKEDLNNKNVLYYIPIGIIFNLKI